MSGFSAEWLALREPADVAARSPAVTAAIADALAGRPLLRVTDLGSGTGSNVRYLAPRLPGPQEWLLVDNDAALLNRARSLLTDSVDTHMTDLRTLDGTMFARRDLVTASALLDLVSEMWLAGFVGHCRKAEAAVLVALNYDGRIICSPEDEDDEFVRALVNRHQHTDKGFGPALGPNAGRRAEIVLREAGYEVCLAKSDWVIGSEHAELQRELIGGWAGAAIELSPPDAARVRAWAARRHAMAAAGTSSLLVGHDDVGGVLR